MKKSCANNKKKQDFSQKSTPNFVDRDCFGIIESLQKNSEQNVNALLTEVSNLQKINNFIV